MGYALRDAFGLKDLAEDTKATLRGEGINYRAFEPSEGGMHIGAARERRIRAGLRYSAGGKRKYWLPEVRGLGDRNAEDVTAPLLEEDAEDVVHVAPDIRHQEQWQTIGMSGDDVDVEDDDEYALHFNDALATVDDSLYDHAKKYIFGDYAYPVVDVSSEDARRVMWAEEERIVREGVHIDIPGVQRNPLGGRDSRGYGATGTKVGPMRKYQDDEDEGFVSDERVEDNRRAEVDASRLRGTNARSRANDSPSISSSSSSSASGLGSGKHLRPSGRSSRHDSNTSRSSHPKLIAGSNVNVRASSPYLHSSPSHSRSNVGTPPSRLLSSGSHPPQSRSPHPPLAEPDAVDLVVATDTLQVPSRSHSLHSPARATGLKRVWDQGRDIYIDSSGIEENDGRFVVNVAEDDEEHIRKEEPDVVEVHEPEEVVRAETPPLHARPWNYDGIRSPEEDEQNPWT